MLLVIGSISLTGCNQSQKEFNNAIENGTIDNIDPFVIVYYEEKNTYKVVYHRETKVMYVISFAHYNCGNFTLLVDSEGKPLLYKGVD